MVPSSKVSYPRFYLLILAFCGFVTAFGAHIINTNLPAYGKMAGVGVFTIGLIIAIYGFAELLMKPTAGFLGDRIGMKIVLQGGIIIFVFSSLFFFFVDPLYLIFIRFLQGVGAAAFSTLSIAMVAKYFVKRRGMAYGIYNMIKGAGYGIAPLTGGFLVSQYGFSSIFVISAGIGGLVFLFVLFLPDDRKRRGELYAEKLTRHQFFEPFREKTLLPVYGAIVTNAFLVGVLFGFLPVYLYGVGYTPVESGTVLTLVTISYIGIQPLAGYLADRVDIHLTVILGLFLAGLSISVATFISGFILVVFVVLVAFGAGIVWTNCDTLISFLVKEEKLGAGMGAAQAFKEFGDMGGPFFIGVMSHYFGVQIGFVICGILALFSLFFLVRSKVFKGALS